MFKRVKKEQMKECMSLRVQRNHHTIHNEAIILSSTKHKIKAATLCPLGIFSGSLRHSLHFPSLRTKSMCQCIAKYCSYARGQQQQANRRGWNQSLIIDFGQVYFMGCMATLAMITHLSLLQKSPASPNIPQLGSSLSSCLRILTALP